MKAFLDEFLPRLLPRIDFLCLKHEGKQDLEKSIPRKLQAWREPGVRFVVVRDNGGANCQNVKARLRTLCEQGGRAETLVRIACQELEAWHLGDFDSLAQAYSKPELAKNKRKSKYSNPDALLNASQDLSRLVPEFRKVDGARRMGKIMPTASGTNRSRSFQVFIEGLRRHIRFYCGKSRKIISQIFNHGSHG
jgi:hypothetical protein